eukprot:358063-Chlamydomonas_euryale.AAC.1
MHASTEFWCPRRQGAVKGGNCELAERRARVHSTGEPRLRRVGALDDRKRGEGGNCGRRRKGTQDM